MNHYNVTSEGSSRNSSAEDKRELRVLSLQEIASMFGVCIGTIQSWDRKGVLKLIRIPGIRKVSCSYEDAIALYRKMGGIN